MEQETRIKDVPPLIYLTDWNKYFPIPKISTLRAYVFNCDKNGFRKVMRRPDRRIQISVKDYFEWVDERDKLYDNR